MNGDRIAVILGIATAVLLLGFEIWRRIKKRHEIRKLNAPYRQD